jgi:hypothetical protein
MNAHDRHVVALNVTREPLVDAAVRLAFYGMDGREIAGGRRQQVSVPANAKTECFVAELPPTGEAPVLARLTLTDSAGRVVALNDYWLPGKNQFLRFASAAQPSLEVTAVPDGSRRARVRVANTGAGVAGAVKLQLIDAATGARVLPAYFSDGWFNLLPGEVREIALDGWAEGVTLGSCRVLATREW